MELKQRIIKGIGWNMLSSFVVQFINFITKIIIARILFPEDFGLFAMAFIIINLLSFLTGFGIASAVIYRKEEQEKTRNTALVLSFCLGLLLAIICFLSGSIIAFFFNQPILENIIRVLSVTFIFDSFSCIFNSILVKDLAFKQKTIAEVGSIVGYSAVIIPVALFGGGIWSLVWGYFTLILTRMILLWLLCPVKPRFSFDRKIAWGLFHFGKYSILASIVTWAITSIDNIFVGKQLGDESLGYYSLSFNLAALPVLSITSIFTSVFHPVYAKLQDDRERLKEAYLKPLEWCLLVMLPLSAGMYLLAERIVTIVFGEKWLLMIPLLKIFAVYCVLRTVCTIIAQLLEGIGKPKNAARVVFIELLLLAVFIFFGIQSGITGVAVAVVLAKAIAMVLYLVEIRRVLPVSLKEYRIILLRKAVATGFMSLSVFAIASLFSPASAVGLCFLITVGAVAYFLVLYLLEKRIFREGWTLICRQENYSLRK